MSGAASARNWKLLSAVLAAALVALVVWNGADRVPPDSSQALAVTPVSAAYQPLTAEVLDIASFNIHSGKGDDDRVDLERTAALLNGADIAALYEVRCDGYDDVDNQATDLGQRLLMSTWFAPTERHWWRNHFGNALLLKGQPTAVQRLPLLGTRGKAFRNAIIAHIPWRDRTLSLIAVHIDREADRVAQLRLIVPLFLSLSAPAILMGYLNTTADDAELAPLFATAAIQSPLQARLGETLPRDNIDWIFTRGLQTLDARLQPNDASDHPVLRVRVALPSDTGRESRAADIPTPVP